MLGLLRLLVGVVMVVGEAGACSGSLQTSHSDGGRDVAVPIDRPVDHAADAGGRPDAPDAGGGCLPVDAAVCPGGAQTECQPTWANVLSHPDCMGNPTGPSGSFASESHTYCGHYDVRSISHGDRGTVYYYDIDSGTLAGEYVYGYSSVPTCYGAADTASHDCYCCPPVTQICADDGGTLGDGSVARD
jgi:hypothetical protein